MVRIAAWWRRLGGAFAACLIAALLLGPTLDSVICLDDELPAAAASVGGAKASAADAGLKSLLSDEAQKHPGEPNGLCLHGHCHHGPAFVQAQPGALRLAKVDSAPQLELRSGLTPSAITSRLDRPPRA